MIKINELRKMVEDIGYYATDELLNDAYNALVLFESNSVDQGQDIYAICLEGPPGAGKTEFAKTYTQISNLLFKNVELVDYQCDATTGKTELFEDINISAAIKGDAEHVNIPGKLIEAIKMVNQGKRVVLFIDEYDKAREETDAFLLQFLQSGKINSTQHGDLSVKDEYKSNLQVILCKNDMREELSGPLSRRIRIIRLESMKPEVFYKVASKIASKVTDEEEKKSLNGLVNLVSLMYEKAYSQQDMYTRLPSCSEMLIAIQDANRLTKGGVQLSYVYKSILKNMFKSEDDMKTFESIVGSSRSNDDLTKLLKSIKEEKHDDKSAEDLDTLIAKNVLTSQANELAKQKEKFENLISEYKQRFISMEEERQKAIDSELAKLKFANGEFVEKELPDAIHTFNDETLNIKRGVSAFSISNDDWCEIAHIDYNYIDFMKISEPIIKHANELGIIVYEDGFKIGEAFGKSLIVVGTNEPVEAGQYSSEKLRLSFLTDAPIISATLLDDISSYAEFVEKNYDMIANNISVGYKMDCLVYNEEPIKYLDKECETVGDPNVYHVECMNFKGNNGSTTYTDTSMNSISKQSKIVSSNGFNEAITNLKNSRRRTVANEQ